MSAQRPPSKRFVEKPYWPMLLGIGFVLSVISGVLLTVASTNSLGDSLQGRDDTGSELEGLLGLLFGTVGGVMLLAGIVGLGVASAAIRPALDLLIDADPQCQRWAAEAGARPVGD